MPIYSGSDPEFLELITSPAMRWARTSAAEIGWDVGAIVMGADPDDESVPAVMIAKIPPGGGIPRHAHSAFRVELQLAGSMKSGDTWLQPGDISVSAPGEFYGPGVAGPEGSTTLEIIARVDGVTRLTSEAGNTDEETAAVSEAAARIERHKNELKAERTRNESRS